MMAAATMPDVTKHHDPNMALQKYLLLQSQHESLLHHLGEIRPPTTTASSTSSAGSPAVSPVRSTYSPSPYARHHSRRSHHTRRDSFLETIVDETTLHALVTEEQKLSAVNEGIKRALTELLNCDSVRQDKELRMWVQCRLMETEKELRSGRRKRSAGSYD